MILDSTAAATTRTSEYTTTTTAAREPLASHNGSNRGQGHGARHRELWVCFTLLWLDPELGHLEEYLRILLFRFFSR
jgi:hypothetical protein